ncbi:response regulator [Paenibacillus sp. J5C_2022]|uniref:response regulator n=1 Tax=Paenibacillus sp. J5C2022 TaxID=2977129 RepID=UPI0021CF9A30|nr:response regulator [Paenibacillus sp. J5C2022]MCU6709486.1 response regulator [Paenibacillus sp. J5C2022]
MWKVVLVDDNRGALRTMKKVIPWQELNAELAGEAIDGQEALQLISSVNPHIVITDIYMPVMNGLEMIEKLRSRAYEGAILILSGYSDFEYARTALRLKVDDYLSKPVTVKTIKEVLGKTIKSLHDRNGQNTADSSRPFISDWTENARHKHAIEHVIQYMHEHYAEDISLNQLSNHVYLSRNHLGDLFRKATGETFVDYLTRIRIERAKELLQEGSLLIYEIAEKVGYRNVPYFSTLFKKHTGMAPSDIVKGYRMEGSG